MVSILYGFKKNITNTIERANQVCNPSAILTKAHQILFLPQTLCGQASDFLAAKTMKIIPHLVPESLKTRYENYCSTKADQCVDQIEKLLVERFKTEELAKEAQKQAKELAAKAQEALQNAPVVQEGKRALNSTVNHLISKLPAFLQINRRTCTDLVDQGLAHIQKTVQSAGQMAVQVVQEKVTEKVSRTLTLQKDNLKKTLLLPLIHSLHNKSVEVLGPQVLSLSFYFGITTLSLYCLNQVATSTLQAYDYSANSVWAMETGLQAYVWGPTLYHLGTSITSIYQKYNAAKQIKDRLNDWKNSAENIATQLNLPKGSSDVILKIVAILLTDVHPLLLSQIASNRDELLQSIGNVLQQSSHFTLLGELQN